MNITLRQLQAFSLTAELGSFTKAARAMHLTQSALSQLVRELEQSIGIKLFDRTTRQLALTQVGVEFLASSNRILNDLDHARANITKWLAHRTGKVVIAAPLVLSSTYLAKVVVGFKNRYPDIELVLQDSLPDEVITQIRNGTADIGVGTLRRTESGLHTQDLFDESMVAIFSSLHPFCRLKKLEWKHLEGQKLLLPKFGSVFRELSEKGFTTAGIAPEPFFEANYVGTLIGLATEGLGIAIVPKYATSLADATKSEWRQLNKPIIKRRVCLVRRLDITMSPAVEAFAQYLVESQKQIN
jgi:DNA-binding transcriptional LysR family regulator